MADRKTTSSTSKKPSKPGSRPAGKAPAKAPARPPAKAPAKRPPNRPGKSIVNQKQTPWGMIITAVVIVAFAVAVIGIALANRKSSPSASGGCTKMIGNNKQTYLNELQCAKDISGVTFKAEPARDHVQGVVKYDAAPPIGGKHSQLWADCDGTVYPNAIASENAVHSLEHGAVWITYRPGLSASEVATLSALVNGTKYTLMSPYPGLASPITVQSWGYQLSVNSASDPRLKTFIKDLKFNKRTTPEYGATCSDPDFKKAPSTFGHPLWVPASGQLPPG